MTQATLSASQSGIGFKRARDVAGPAHLGALIAAEPQIHGVIRDAVLAGFLPEQLLETRLSEVIETATSTHLGALDNDEQATARLSIQKAAQAEDESWQHTFSGQQGSGVAGPTITSVGHPGSAPLKMTPAMTWTFQCPARAVSVGHSSNCSSHD